MEDSPPSELELRVGQRVHASGDSRRIGTVKYVGPVEGHPGTWVGVDWDNGDGKHDGSIKGIRYFHAKCERSGSFVRPQNLSHGISLVEALEIRYRGDSTKDEEDEMYVLSASNKRVSIKLVGKDKVQDKLSRFEELTNASLSYMGVSSPGSPCHINATVPNMKELDLTGNLLSEWKIGCRFNYLDNRCQLLKSYIPTSSTVVQGFDSLRLLNLDNNFIAEWEEIMKLSQLSLEQLYLNKNCLNCIHYPDHAEKYELEVTCHKPFQNLRCLLLGGNNIGNLASVDSLNLFPKLVDVRLSENLITDPARGGVPRFILIARLAKIQILNGSEISPRERRDSEIRYVRLVISRLLADPEEIKQHPRFPELKKFYGIEEERTSTGASGPQTMASGLLSITLKCVGPSMGEKPPLTKKLPAATTVGKLKLLCESFFKLQSVKLKLYLQEEGSPMPLLLDNDMASLFDIGIGNESIILVDEES